MTAEQAADYGLIDEVLESAAGDEDDSGDEDKGKQKNKSKQE